MKRDLLDALGHQLQNLGGTASPSRFPDASGAELRTWASHVGSTILVDRDNKLLALETPSLTEVMAQQDANYVARFRGLFAGLSLIVESDEGGVMASWAPLKSGSSQTYKVHQDEWGLSKFAPSIGGALIKSMEVSKVLKNAYAKFDKVAGKEKPTASLDPSALWKASEWLVDVFLDISVNDLAAQLKSTMPYKIWEESKEQVSLWPQLANYWLLAHWAFGNDEALKETLELTEALTHPSTTEIRALVGGDGGFVARKRDTLIAMAPAKALSAEAKKRKQALEKELKTETAEVKATKEQLDADANASRARTLFAELTELSAKDPWLKEVFGRRPVAIREFADAIDERWLPILLHHQRLAARFVDTHKLAIPGLVLGLAKLCKKYAAFHETIEGMGTGSFGISRKEELAVAVGEFILDPEALKWLVDQARAWADRIEEWDIGVSPAFEHVLLHHALPETFALIDRVLSAETFHGGNWRICVTTAVAAGNLNAKPCVPALRGALERGLGRTDNGERDAVRRALEGLVLVTAE